MILTENTVLVKYLCSRAGEIRLGPVSAPRTARDRIRHELTTEILAVARAQLAVQGAAALSLRSIARDLGMAPSALYRYFDGRDALLSALILGAYTSLADEAEQAAETAHQSGQDDLERWAAVPHTMRSWALARPHEWGLLFGSPVPGYSAPEETVGPYARLATALVRPLVDALHGGRLADATAGEPAATELGPAVAPVHQALFPDAAATTVVGVLQAWAVLVGAISLEVFGHWRNTVLDPARFFEATVADTARALGLRA
jgi:AcrR family transcriptional regulator